MILIEQCNKSIYYYILDFNIILKLMKNKILLSLIKWNSTWVISKEFQVQEKIIQQLVSKHIETLFDCYLLWNEISFKQDTSLRIDSLCLTKDWKLIIIEYKKQWFSNMLTQPLAYSTYLKKYQWDVLLLINKLEEKLWKEKSESLPDISILCIAWEFSNHDLEWSIWLQQAIWFYQYTLFSSWEDNLQLLLDCKFKNKAFQLFEKKILIELNEQQKEAFITSQLKEIIDSRFFQQFWYTCSITWNQYTQIYFIKDELWKTIFSFSFFKNMRSFYLEISSFYFEQHFFEEKYKQLEFECELWQLPWISKIIYENNMLNCKITEIWKHNLQFTFEKILKLFCM